MPDGPYNLWRPGETARRVKDLAGSFAQLPQLLKIKAKTNIPLKFFIRIEMGDGKTVPPEAIKEINTLLNNVKEDFRLK